MIRICKNADKPQTLDKGYNRDEVCKQLLMDQNDKCYLCERHLTTDYQVEHFKSQANNGDLKQTWENLFVACGYCNNKKSNKYDDILNPNHNDIETIIKHSNDFVNQKVIFNSDHATSEVLSTIQLLNLLFNGKLPYRNCREQRFYDEFIQKMNFFSYAVNEYMSGKKEDYYPVIKELLDIRSEYLGFKYAIIHSNDLLKHDFGDMTIWNKKGE
ncbi:HNH endonuclease [Candidatus Bacteroides intestinigallinarum]|uniref:HNH endonuclease n=1 Tax=Candidatus Bacteroides intestinigallinarum TaxID=2838470 RepID=UPI00216515DE|nr:HNH endonuclease [Candidatus Bacteroides intestinigallinarum]MCS3199289.1 HNH endonuclease [Candidatus Bacteroides intestinigallinarum]